MTWHHGKDNNNNHIIFCIPVIYFVLYLSSILVSFSFSNFLFQSIEFSFILKTCFRHGIIFYIFDIFVIKRIIMMHIEPLLSLFFHKLNDNIIIVLPMLLQSTTMLLAVLLALRHRLEKLLNSSIVSVRSQTTNLSINVSLLNINCWLKYRMIGI